MIGRIIGIIVVIILIIVGVTSLVRMTEVSECEDYKVAGLETNNTGFLKECKIKFEGEFIVPTKLDKLKDARLLKNTVDFLEGRE